MFPTSHSTAPVFASVTIPSSLHLIHPDNRFFSGNWISAPLSDPAHIIACLRSLPRKSSPHTLQIRDFAKHLHWLSRCYSTASSCHPSAPSHLCSPTDSFDTIDRADDSMAPSLLLPLSSRNNDFPQPDFPLLLSSVSFPHWILLIIRSIFLRNLRLFPPALLFRTPIPTVRVWRRCWRRRLRTHWCYLCGISF